MQRDSKRKKTSSSADDIRWPWESNEDNSPPPHSPTPQNSPHSSGSQQPAGQLFVQAGASSHHPKRSQTPESDPDRRLLHSNLVQQDAGHQPVVLEVFVHDMLQAHNKYRALHRVPPLKLDKNLTKGAQHWAEVIAGHDKLEPDTAAENAHVGESLAMKYNSQRTDFTGAQFTDYWYSGIADYDFDDRSPRMRQGSSVLSFTQMVWKNSSMVGFGRAVSRQGRVYVVGRYFPCGNSVEGFVQNVLPAGKHEIVQKEPLHSPREAAMRSTGSRISEYSEASIEAWNPNDTLVSTRKSTEHKNDRTVVTFEEKYKMHDGSTYTRQRKTTYFGVQHPDNN